MALSKNSKIEVADINAISSTASSALSTANTANTNATNAYNLANSKQNNLGFTPIQQGGGAYQGTNKVYIGWDGSALRCQVDSTDLGQIFTSNVGKTTVNWADGAWSATVTPSVVSGNPTGSSFTLPSGGTWRYLAFTHNDVYVYSPTGSSASGGATISLTDKYPKNIIYIAVRVA